MARFIESDTRKVVVVPVAGIVDASAPKAAELNAGVDLADAMLQPYTLGMTASDTVSEPIVSDTENSSAPTRGNYGADITLFRHKDADEADDPFFDAVTALSGKGTEVYIAERISDTKGSGDAFAADDVCSFIGRFVLDNKLSVPGDNGYAKVQVTPLHAGEGYEDVTVAADA